MTARISDYKNALFSRNYSFDLPQQTQYIQRLAAASIPFLSFYQPFQKPLSLIMSTCRLWNIDSKNNFSTHIQRLVTITSLAGTVFKHPAGMIISTIHDLILESQNLCRSKTKEEAFSNLIKISNSLAYLALMSRGGLELSVLSFAIQTLMSLVQSKDEFKKGRWIEGCANLLMGSIRLKQTHTQYQLLKHSWEIEAAQNAFKYFLDEVEKDAVLTHKEQHEKIQEFKTFANKLSPGASTYLTKLIIVETRSRINEMLQNAALNPSEIEGYLAGYDEAILKVNNMNVEIAREMLFFVAELKIHRQYVYDFGIALGCPEKQLLRHDLCKLDVDQFEGYARYYRGGRREEDKLAYLAAWEIHQYEEHHHESYSKEGFDFDKFPEERLRNNMLESVSDLLASSKQRGGSTLIEWLTTSYPKKHPHPRLLPYFEEALKKAQELHQDSENNPNSEFKIFQGLPCWNQDVEEAFNKMKS